MNQSNQNKRNALLGGLLVFIVPLLAVSIVYFTASKLPKSKDVPILQSANTVGDFSFISDIDTVSNGSLWKDVKVLFWVESDNVNQRVASLKKLIDFSHAQPEFTIKDPYPQIYFLALNEEGVEAEVDEKVLLLQPDTNSPVFDNKSNIYLLDQKENIRGEYQFTTDDIELLYQDTQYVLQDVFYANADTLRVKRLFKTTEDEQ